MMYRDLYTGRSAGDNAIYHKAHGWRGMLDNHRSAGDIRTTLSYYLGGVTSELYTI